MNKVLAFSTLAATMFMSAAALADTTSTPYHPDVQAPAPVPFKVGMSVDLSVPSGAAVGVQVRLPSVPWFKLGVAGTYTLAPGLRGNILIDPIKFPVAPVANVDFGHQFGFTLPGVNNSPTVDFDYVDLQGGLAFGSRDGFRFMLLGGMSYLNGTANHFQGVVSSGGLTVADPHFSGWIPDAKIGVEWLF